jgi:hypothetical protein
VSLATESLALLEEAQDPAAAQVRGALSGWRA